RPGVLRIVGGIGQLRGPSAVEEGVHHPGHRDRGAGSDGKQQWSVDSGLWTVLRIRSLSTVHRPLSTVHPVTTAGCLFDAREAGADLFFETLRPGSAGGVKV